jgi:hypothetical protein
MYNESKPSGKGGGSMGMLILGGGILAALIGGAYIMKKKGSPALPMKGSGFAGTGAPKPGGCGCGH